MNTTRRLFNAGLALSALATITGTAFAKGKANHHNGAKLLGDKIKTKGKSNHVIDKKGMHTVSLDVSDGKIAGMHVKHAKKGELPVTKYKTKKKMAQRDSAFQYAAYMTVQDTYLGTSRHIRRRSRRSSCSRCRWFRDTCPGPSCRRRTGRRCRAAPSSSWSCTS